MLPGTHSVMCHVCTCRAMARQGRAILSKGHDQCTSAPSWTCSSCAKLQVQGKFEPSSLKLFLLLNCSYVVGSLKLQHFHLSPKTESEPCASCRIRRKGSKRMYILGLRASAWREYHVFEIFEAVGYLTQVTVASTWTNQSFDRSNIDKQQIFWCSGARWHSWTALDSSQSVVCLTSYTAKGQTLRPS